MRPQNVRRYLTIKEKRWPMLGFVTFIESLCWSLKASGKWKLNECVVGNTLLTRWNTVEFLWIPKNFVNFYRTEKSMHQIWKALVSWRHIHFFIFHAFFQSRDKFWSEIYRNRTVRKWRPNHTFACMSHHSYWVQWKLNK